MAQAIHLRTRLSSLDHESLRQLSQSIAGQFRIPSPEEAVEQLEDLFSKMRPTPPLRVKQNMAAISCRVRENANRCHDELGGTTFLFSDKKKVRVFSDMSQRKILYALKKAHTPKAK